MKLSIKDIRQILLPDSYVTDDSHGAIVIRRLLTDSRSLESPEDTLFFAIPTSGNDGHKFIADLYSRGVRNFVVNHIPSRLQDTADACFIVVDDTVKALQKVAARRPEFEGHILAITGSRGKTTLKEWIFQLMEPLSDISRSPRSYNSQIGVPLSMWEIEPSSRLAVIEAGISRPGEMAPLRDCINPDTVIITNIGEAHSEGFYSDEEKAREKALLPSAPKTKTVIFHADDRLIAEAVAKSAPEVHTFTWSESDPEADIIIKAAPLGGEMQ